MNALNPDKLKVAKDYARKDIFLSVARRPDDGRLYLGSSDFKVYELDLAAAKPEPQEIGSHESYVTGLALVGDTLVSGSYDGRLVWWDVAKRTQVRAVEAHAKWVRRVVRTPDGTRLVSVADDMVCRVWDAASGKMVRELRGHAEKTPHHYGSMLYAVAVAPDGRHLATGDKTGIVKIWEADTGKEVGKCEAPVMYTWDPVQRVHSIGGIRSLAFAPDGKHLAVGGMGKVGNIDHLEGKARVEVFEWASGTRVQEYPGDRFNGLVQRLEYHPSGDWLLGAGGAGEGFLMFFDLKAKKAVRQEKVAGHVHDAAVSPEWDAIACACHGRVVTYTLS